MISCCGSGSGWVLRGKSKDNPVGPRGLAARVAGVAALHGHEDAASVGSGVHYARSEGHQVT